MNESTADRVLREDLILFINSCFAATDRSEFYHRASQQRASLRFVHEYVLGNYRTLYALTLAAAVNDHNTALIIENLLANPLRYDGAALEGELIRHALRRIRPPRAFRLFGDLRRGRVNNRRTRAVMRDYIAWRKDIELDAMKYRSGFANAARHAHLQLPGEIGAFVFEHREVSRFESPLLEAWRAAHYAQEAMYRLPYSIAEGFAAKHGVDRKRFLERIAPQMTVRERQRMQASSQKVGVSKELSGALASMRLEHIVPYVLSLPHAERTEKAAELAEHIARAAKKTAARADAVSGTIASVLDTSYSSRGSREQKNRPLATAIGARYLFDAISGDHRAFYTRAPAEPAFPFLDEARGQTSIARPLLDALETQPQWVVIVSDGWENNPPGGAHGVVRLFEEAGLGADTAILHVNPVFDSERYEPRRLSPLIPTIGVRTAADILAVLPYVEFAAGRRPASQLEHTLRVQALRFCEESA